MIINGNISLRILHDNKSHHCATDMSILQTSMIDSTAELLGLNIFPDNRTTSLTLNTSSVTPSTASITLNRTGSSQSLHDQTTPNLSLHATPNSGSINNTKEPVRVFKYILFYDFCYINDNH